MAEAVVETNAQPEIKQDQVTGQAATTLSPDLPANLNPEQLQAMIRQAQESQTGQAPGADELPKIEASQEAAKPKTLEQARAEDHDPSAAPKDPGVLAGIDQALAYASDPSNHGVPAEVTEKLSELVGRKVGALSSITPDSYKHESLNTVVLTVPTDPTLSVQADEAAIKASLQKDPALAALLTEPLGRKLEKMLETVPVTEAPKDPSQTSDPNGFDPLERAALSGWRKPMEAPQGGPIDDTTIALVFKVDEQNKAKIFDNLNSRAAAIGEEITANGKLPVEVSVQQAPEGIAVILRQSPQAPGAKPDEPPAANMESVINHAILYAGDGWQEAFGGMSSKEQRKSYLEFLGSQKNPEVQASLQAAQENTGPSFSKVIGPIPEHPQEFRVELVLPKGQTQEQLYTAIASGAGPKAPATPEQPKVQLDAAQAEQVVPPQLQHAVG